MVWASREDMGQLGGEDKKLKGKRVKSTQN